MNEGPVSATSYVVEPPDLWSSLRVPNAPKWDDSTPGWAVGDYRCPVLAADVQALLSDAGPRGLQPVRLSELPTAIFEPDGRIAAQDRAGVAAEVLYPSPRLGAAIGLLLDAEAEIACVRAYNEWLADFVRHAPERLIGVAQIPSQGGIAAAMEELHRANELGLRGCLLRAFPTGSQVPDSDDEEFWSELVESETVLSFDSSFGFIPDSGPVGGFPLGPNAATPLTALVYQAVVERFPTMLIAVSNPIAGWIPYWLERGDDLYLRSVRSQNPELTRALPSDYLRKRPFFTFSGNDPILSYSEDYISFSHLMWSSQFPTFYALEGALPIPALSDIDPAYRDQVLGGTCRALYRLPGAAQIDLEPSLGSLPHAVPV
jgi:predicted TIM-barrel fold metal-dependent hydrolase